MAYDEELADRMRVALAARTGVSEKRMFGGLAFLVGGHLAIAASNEGGALVRVDPAECDALAEEDGVSVAVMRGRPMTGWLRVTASMLADDDALEAWAGRGADYAGSLPPKR